MRDDRCWAAQGIAAPGAGSGQRSVELPLKRGDGRGGAVVPGAGGALRSEQWPRRLAGLLAPAAAVAHR